MFPLNCSFFADDTTLLSSANNLDTVYQLSIHSEQHAEKWFCANQLKLNQDKTQRLVFSSGNNNLNADSATLLGVVLDDSLNWFCHVDLLSKKLSSVIFLLRNLKQLLTPQLLRTSYFSLFHSNISYALVLWGNSCHAIRIFRQQKQAVRILANVGTREHCRPLFIKLGIMSLPCFFIYVTLCEIHKNIDSFLVNGDFHNYATRHNNVLRKPRFRLAKSEKNSLNLDFYNHVPQHIKAMAISEFKINIKRYLLEHCFYTTSEYLDVPFM